MSAYGPNAALNVDWGGSIKSEPPYALYFFRSRQYIRWDIDEETVCAGYPRAIAEGWPGLLELFPGHALSGAMHVPGWHNKIYFFFRDQDQVVSWDVARHELDGASGPIGDLLPSALTTGAHFAPLYVDTGEEQKVYAFRGDAYTRWTVRDGEVPRREDDGYPRKIGDGWTDGISIAPTCAVYVHWTRRSEALLNRKIYFFLGDLYTRWDVGTHSNNYRLDIPSGWQGWPKFD